MGYSKYTFIKISNETDLNEAYEPMDYEDTTDEDDPFMKNKVLERKMCLCDLGNKNQVYISKYDTIEIEFEVILNKSETKNYDFQIKYEFMDRMCNNLVVSNIKSTNKGKFSL